MFRRLSPLLHDKPVVDKMETVFLLFCFAAYLAGASAADCQFEHIETCMGPMRQYSMDALSELFPRYREDALKELCEHYEDAEDCFKPLTKVCLPTIKMQLDAMEDAFDFLCEDGMEDYKKFEECFEASEYIGATQACLDDFFEKVNIEAERGDYPTCHDMSELVMCGYRAAKFLCGDPAGFWQCKQSKHALRALFIGNTSCSLDCDTGDSQTPQNSTEDNEKQKEQEPQDGGSEKDTRKENDTGKDKGKENDNEKEADNEKEKENEKEEKDHEKIKDKDGDKSPDYKEDGSSSREELDTGNDENRYSNAVHRYEERDDHGNVVGILIGVMGGVLLVGMIIVIIGFCRHRVKKRARADERPIVNDGGYPVTTPPIFPLTGPSSVLFVAPPARGAAPLQEGVQLVNGKGGAASYGGTVDEQNAHNANVAGYI